MSATNGEQIRAYRESKQGKHGWKHGGAGPSVHALLRVSYTAGRYLPAGRGCTMPGATMPGMTVPGARAGMPAGMPGRPGSMTGGWPGCMRKGRKPCGVWTSWIVAPGGRPPGWPGRTRPAAPGTIAPGSMPGRPPGRACCAKSSCCWACIMAAALGMAATPAVGRRAAPPGSPAAAATPGAAAAGACAAAVGVGMGGGRGTFLASCCCSRRSATESAAAGAQWGGGVGWVSTQRLAGLQPHASKAPKHTAARRSRPARQPALAARQAARSLGPSQQPYSPVPSRSPVLARARAITRSRARPGGSRAAKRASERAYMPGGSQGLTGRSTCGAQAWCEEAAVCWPV